MVAMYSIAGRQVGSHWLAMATLGAVFGIPMVMGGGKSAKQQTTPPLNAGSKDEEKFIQEFMQSIEQEEKAGKEKAGH